MTGEPTAAEVILWILLKSVGATIFRGQGDQKQGDPDACQQHDQDEETDKGGGHKNGIEGNGFARAVLVTFRP